MTNIPKLVLVSVVSGLIVAVITAKIMPQSAASNDKFYI